MFFCANKQIKKWLINKYILRNFFSKKQYLSKNLLPSNFNFWSFVYFFSCLKTKLIYTVYLSLCFKCWVLGECEENVKRVDWSKNSTIWKVLQIFSWDQDFNLNFKLIFHAKKTKSSDLGRPLQCLLRFTVCLYSIHNFLIVSAKKIAQFFVFLWKR